MTRSGAAEFAFRAPRVRFFSAGRVWGYAMAHGDRSVDVFVRKLRQKLEKRSPDHEYIHTHFGVGYRFDPETGAAEDAIAAPTVPDAPPLAEQELAPASQVVHKSFTAA